MDDGQAAVSKFHARPHRLGDRLLDALDECARERLLGRRDLLRLDLCTREAEAVLAGLHITLTGEDTVPAEAVPVAQMTFAPEGGVSPMDPPTDHDLGRFPLEFNAWCRARLDRTAVRTVRAFTTPPSATGTRLPHHLSADAASKAT